MQHAFEVLRLIRERGWTLRRASREVGIDPRSALRIVGPALRTDRRGHYAARASDQLVRHVTVFTREEGKVEGPVRGSKQASLVGSHWNAIGDHLEGRPSALRKFRGQMIQVGRKRYTLVSDPRVVDRLGAEGDVSFESIYRLTR